MIKCVTHLLYKIFEV